MELNIEMDFLKKYQKECFYCRKNYVTLHHCPILNPSKEHEMQYHHCNITTKRSSIYYPKDLIYVCDLCHENYSSVSRQPNGKVQ